MKQALDPMNAYASTRAVALALLLCVALPAGAACPDSARPSAPQTAFGPEQEPETLIAEVIGSAKTSVRAAAFAFSSPPVAKALAEAARRGVDVRVVADHKHNIDEDAKRIGRRAFDTVAAAGGTVRTNGHYRLHHDKFIVVDDCHVQTGSWNYAESAKRNSENVVVLWNNPAVARAYLAHWQSRFDEGKPYRP